MTRVCLFDSDSAADLKRNREFPLAHFNEQTLVEGHMEFDQELAGNMRWDDFRVLESKQDAKISSTEMCDSHWVTDCSDLIRRFCVDL